MVDIFFSVMIADDLNQSLQNLTPQGNSQTVNDFTFKCKKKKIKFS